MASKWRSKRAWAEHPPASRVHLSKHASRSEDTHLLRPMQCYIQKPQYAWQKWQKPVLRTERRTQQQPLSINRKGRWNWTSVGGAPILKGEKRRYRYASVRNVCTGKMCTGAADPRLMGEYYFYNRPHSAAWKMAKDKNSGSGSSCLRWTRKERRRRKSETRVQNKDHARRMCKDVVCI